MDKVICYFWFFSLISALLVFNGFSDKEKNTDHFHVNKLYWSSKIDKIVDRNFEIFIHYHSNQLLFNILYYILNHILPLQSVLCIKSAITFFKFKKNSEKADFFKRCFFHEKYRKKAEPSTRRKTFLLAFLGVTSQQKHCWITRQVNN